MAYRKSKARLLGDLFGKASIFTRKTGDSIKLDTDSSGVVSSSTTVANSEFQSFVANTNTLIATKVDSSSLADVATSGSYSDLTGNPIATGDSTPKVTFSQNEPASIDAIGEVWYDTNDGNWYISVDSGIVSPVGPSSIDTTNTTSWVGFNNNTNGNLTFPYNRSGNITITFNTPLWLNYFKGEAGGNHHGIITRVYYEDGTDVAGPPAPQYAGGHTITSTNSLFTYGRVTKLDLFTYSGQGWNGKSTLRAAGAPIWQEVLAPFSGSYNDLTDTPTIPSTTGLATETYVDTAVSNIVNTAPTTLNTLNELAAALNDDANFATTVTTSLASKAANSYVNSTFVSNTAFQSFVANTNSALSAGGGSTVVVSDTAPSSPSEGDLWFNSTNLKTFIYYSSSWVQTNPSGTGVGVSNTAFQSFVANTNSSFSNYWPSANVISYVAANPGGVSNAYVTSAISTAISDLVDTAPSTLDTLNELAAALGDDANFASTVTTSLAGKASNAAFQSALANTNAYIASVAGSIGADINSENVYIQSSEPNVQQAGVIWYNPSSNVWKISSQQTRPATINDVSGSAYYTGYPDDGWDYMPASSFWDSTYQAWRSLEDWDRYFRIYLSPNANVSSITKITGSSDWYNSIQEITIWTPSNGWFTISPGTANWTNPYGESLVSRIDFRFDRDDPVGSNRWRINLQDAVAWTEFVPGSSAVSSAISTSLNSTLSSYWPSANVISYVGTELASLVDSAPATLDTLNELAAALGDDANFASTITTSLAGKAANSYVNSTFVSNNSFQTFVANTNAYIAASAGGGGGLTYSTKTSNYTASSGEGILADTSGGSFTITLPASPSEGDQVIIADSGDFFSNNNLTVDRNGSTIIGDAEDLVLNIDTSSTTLIYDGSTWQIYVQSRKAIVPEGASGDSGDSVSTGKSIAMSIVFG